MFFRSENTCILKTIQPKSWGTRAPQKKLFYIFSFLGGGMGWVDEGAGKVLRSVELLKILR